MIFSRAPSLLSAHTLTTHHRKFTNMSLFSHPGKSGTPADPRAGLVQQIKVEERSTMQPEPSGARMSPSSPSTPVAVPMFDPPAPQPEPTPPSQAERPAEQGWQGLYNRPFQWLFNKTSWRIWSLLLIGPSLTERIERAKTRLKELTTDMGLTATAVNSKGGSAKSYLMAALSTLTGWVTNQSVGVGDLNPHEGNIHTRLGVEKTVALIDLLWGKVTGLISHETMGEMVGHHPNDELRNVHVFKFSNEPAGTQFAEPGVEYIKKALRFLRSLNHFMFLDQGNGYGSNWALAADEVSDVILISVVPWQENSAGGALGALEFLKRSYQGISLRCILAVSGHKGRITPQVVEAYAAQYGIPPERVVVIPYDKNCEPLPQEKGAATPVQPVRVIDPRKIRQQTLLAYLNCAILMAQITQTYKRVNPTHPNQ